MKFLIALLLLTGCSSALSSTIEAFGADISPPQGDGGSLYSVQGVADGGIDTGALTIPAGCGALLIITQNTGSGSTSVQQLHEIFNDGTDLELFTLAAQTTNTGAVIAWASRVSSTMPVGISIAAAGAGNLSTYAQMLAPVPPQLRYVVGASSKSVVRVDILCAH